MTSTHIKPPIRQKRSSTGFLLGSRAILALLLLLCASCTRLPREGEIVDKIYQPQTMRFMHVTINGNLHLIPITDDEDWVLVLTNGNRTWRIIVSETEFHAATIGDYFP